MKKLLFIMLFGFIFSSFAEGAQPNNAAIKEGTDYTQINPIGVVPANLGSGKVNVKEFFSFACYHCKMTEPFVQQSIVNNPKIDFQMIQVNFGGDAYTGFAKIAATLNNLKSNKAIYALYPKVFDATFQVEKSGGDVNKFEQNLATEKGLRSFLTTNQISKKDQNTFINVFNSFSINAKTQEFTNLTSKYNITGTPTFIVADKYMVSPAQPERLVYVVNQLVNQLSAKK